jgi:hypothetical protein
MPRPKTREEISQDIATLENYIKAKEDFEKQAILQQPDVVKDAKGDIVKDLRRYLNKYYKEQLEPERTIESVAELQRTKQLVKDVGLAAAGPAPVMTSSLWLLAAKNKKMTELQAKDGRLQWGKYPLEFDEKNKIIKWGPHQLPLNDAYLDIIQGKPQMNRADGSQNYTEVELRNVYPMAVDAGVIFQGFNSKNDFKLTASAGGYPIEFFKNLYKSQRVKAPVQSAPSNPPPAQSPQDTPQVTPQGTPPSSPRAVTTQTAQPGPSTSQATLPTYYVSNYINMNLLDKLLAYQNQTTQADYENKVELLKRKENIEAKIAQDVNDYIATQNGIDNEKSKGSSGDKTTIKTLEGNLKNIQLTLDAYSAMLKSYDDEINIWVKKGFGLKRQRYRRSQSDQARGKGVAKGQKGKGQKIAKVSQIAKRSSSGKKAKGAKAKSGLKYYFTNTQDVRDRLNLIVGSVRAGNTSVDMKNEGTSLLDYLARAGEISKPVYNKIAKMLI